jgi:hypothetical protein
MNRALLIGAEPPCVLGYTYVSQPPYDAVVIGSLPLPQALVLTDENILTALGEGKPVILYTPGLPQVTKNRALSASLAASRRQMKNWGILFTDGAQKKLVTAQEARLMRQSGKTAAPGAVLTPLAREILEGSD